MNINHLNPPKAASVTLAIRSARSVLHLVPAAEDRPRLAIEAAERWLTDPSEKNRLAARTASYAACDAADAAYAAARDAADATCAAADATYAACAAARAAAAADAADAACDAADAADAACDAAAAADAADAAATFVAADAGV